MAFLGPMVVVAETSAADLVTVLEKAGAFPIVEVKFADAPAAVAEIQPVALVVADPTLAVDARSLAALAKKIDNKNAPYMPVFARADGRNMVELRHALPIAMD